MVAGSAGSRSCREGLQAGIVEAKREAFEAPTEGSCAYQPLSLAQRRCRHDCLAQRFLVCSSHPKKRQVI
jgi:hypothetical protein